MQQRTPTPFQSLHRTWLARATAALLAASAFAYVPHAQAGVFVSVNIAPPPLPVYEQPYMPGPGYMWTPGYWAWDGDINDYYWVPGTWVRPPVVGVLWTPGYWGWNNNLYYFHPGYWGPHIGYYGGINYGFGYIGVGYYGGYWRNGGFWYNRAYNRYGSGISINFYDRHVDGDVSINHFSFNGPGGWDHRPTADEDRYEHERHMEPSREQLEHMDRARHDESLRASVNHGKPALAAVAHAGGFEHGHEVERHEVDTGAHGDHHHGGTPEHHESAAMGHASAEHHEHSHGTENGHTMHTEAQHHEPSHMEAPHHESHMEAPHHEPTHMEAPRQAPHPAAEPKHSEPHPSGGKPHDDHKH